MPVDHNDLHYTAAFVIENYRDAALYFATMQAPKIARISLVDSQNK